MAGPTNASKRQYCSGCRNDYYNGQNEHGVDECWSLKSAKVVTRFKLGWWTNPTEPRAFQEVKTLSCHHAPGRYAMCENLPAFAVNARRLQPDASDV